jgi:hypothetical protein
MGIKRWNGTVFMAGGTLRRWDGTKFHPDPNGFSATGGTIADVGAYRVHTFLVSGTFQVISGTKDVEYLIVAGGGGGSGGTAGGGGGGGVLTNVGAPLSRTVGYFPVVVGAGGAANTAYDAQGYQGADSTAFGLTALGGGVGAITVGGNSYVAGTNGGSGGGGCSYGGYAGPAGAGTTGQGYAGGPATAIGGVGGGGAGGAATSTVRNGGAGLSSALSGAIAYYAGGGGGAGNGDQGTGGIGGGGNGATATATSGTANTGGGGGSGWFYANGQGGSGGSGIVIVRYLL